MYYIYLFLSLLNMDQFFPGAGKATMDDAMSMFTKADKKLNRAIVQLEKSEDMTKSRLEKLRIQFQQEENRLNEMRRSLVDNRVKSKKSLEKIKSFLED